MYIRCSQVILSHFLIASFCYNYPTQCNLISRTGDIEINICTPLEKVTYLANVNLDDQCLLQINGKLTLGENIADNGGFKASFRVG